MTSSLPLFPADCPTVGKENKTKTTKPKQNYDSNVGLEFPVQWSGENQPMKCNRLHQLSEPVFEG